jgi:hypothetical protein
MVFALPSVPPFPGGQKPPVRGGVVLSMFQQKFIEKQANAVYPPVRGGVVFLPPKDGSFS